MLSRRTIHTCGEVFILYVQRVYGVGTVRTRIVCPSCTELCGRLFCAPEKIVTERVGDPTRKKSHSPFFIAIPISMLMYHTL
ncbi:hypothetical protein ANCDUO_03689 [Ancylostoma duodenale]|uniref:Uncharacterized protein n=1 Tax=Ancylostoma duodenale TaxID=51022 RepID=A0A0C2DT83_9BILA|nr:hypothetical protein ANCDUO_03689 [Ancylostoma duodenale]